MEIPTLNELNDLDSAALLKKTLKIPENLNSLKISECEFELENAVTLLLAVPKSSLQDLEISSSLPSTGEKVRMFILDKLRHGPDGDYRENFEKFDSINLKSRSAATLRSYGGRHFLTCRALVMAGIGLKRLVLRDIQLGAAVKQDVVTDLTLPTLSERFLKKINLPILPVFHAIDCLAVSLKFSNLEIIDFSNNSLFDAAIVKFAEYLPSAKSLREINLSGNCISDFGFMHILVNASESQKINLVDLSDNQITLDADFSKFAESALQKWGSNKTIKLALNPINLEILSFWKDILAGFCNDLESRPQSSETVEEISRSISLETSSAGSVDPESAALLQAVVGDESLPSSDDDSEFTDIESASD